jgi:hypothetical protein
MEVKIDINSFSDLERLCWSGAQDTLAEIREAGKEDKLMEALEMIYADGETPTLTQINDTLWFIDDDSFLKEQLGLDSDEDREYTIVETDLEGLKEEVQAGRLSQRNYEIIENSVKAGCNVILQSELEDLTEDELEILDDIG